MVAGQGRTCAGCGAQNLADARFCEQCGTPLERSCPDCGTEASVDSAFCRMCGRRFEAVAPVPTASAVPAEAEPAVRKSVTVLFADLGGSTAFEEAVDVESAREVMGRYHAMLAETVADHRAGVTKFVGDGFMAVWGVPEITELDAARAVSAGVALQSRFGELADDVEHRFGVAVTLRVAVNTGEVAVGAADADLVGDAVNVAARLEKECPTGSVVVGEETWRATRDSHDFTPLGEVLVKGRGAPVAVYELVGERQTDEDEVPFVGRVEEQARLAATWAPGNRAGARMVTVIGEPGVGKSRLVREFVHRLEGAVAVEVACDPEVPGALAPAIEAVRLLVEHDGEDGARDGMLDDLVPASSPDRERLVGIVGDLLGAGARTSIEETFWAIRRVLELRASRQATVLVVDDLQWADPLLLDLLEHLVEWVRDVDVLVLAVARPELRELRQALTEAGPSIVDVLALGGLDEQATSHLAEAMLGSAVPDELLRRLPLSTQGNPLFVRELVRMLVLDGVLAHGPEGWRLTIDADAIDIPPSVQSLLGARIERLSPVDRRVLEGAAIVGADFSPAAVRVASEVGDEGLLESSLTRLRRFQLIESTGSYAGDDPLWRFHHALIRDVAYRRVLKAVRARRHESLAEWMALQDGGSVVDEAVGHHLQAAHRYRTELGESADSTRQLALRGAHHLLRAARAAMERDELASAGSLATRGAELAGTDAELAPALVLVACDALLSTGDVTAAAPMVDRLAEIADARIRPWVTCFRCEFLVYTDPDSFLEVDRRLGVAIEELRASGDDSGLAKAHLVRASARARLGRVGDAEVDLDEAIVAARRAGDRRLVSSVLAAAPAAALWGPSPVPRAGGRCLDVIRLQRITTAAASVEATSVRCQAVLEALRGRLDNARSMLASSRRTAAELGLRHGLLETELFEGIIETISGDHPAAEPHFRAALDGLGALGVGVDAGQAAAMLARCLLAQGRLDDADEFASVSESMAGHNLKSAIAWRSVRSEILAHMGRFDDATALIDEALRIAAETDIVLDHADAHATSARVWAIVGDEARSTAARAAADDLYRAKGAVALVSSLDGAPRASAGDVRDKGGAAAAPSRHSLRSDNTAASQVDRLFTALEREDFVAVGDCIDIDATQDDRRSLPFAPIVGREAWVDAFRGVREQFDHLHHEHLETRGDDLVATRFTWTTDRGDETRFLTVTESGGDRIIEVIRFDHDDLDACIRELDRRSSDRERRSLAAEVVDSSSRLALRNRATETSEFVWDAWRRRDYDAIDARYVDDVRQVDERTLGTSPVDGRSAHRAAAEMLAEQFVDVTIDVRAVRGELLALVQLRFVSEGGSESRSLVVGEVDHAGRVVEIIRFDEDDLDAAVRELDRRYYEGEGSACAESGLVASEADSAIRRGDWERFRDLHHPDVVWRTTDASLLPSRTRDELIESQRSLWLDAEHVTSWVASYCWLSPTCCVLRYERRIVQADGPEAAWSFLFVNHFERGLLIDAWVLSPEDEDEAFAHAEALIAPSADPLAVDNLAARQAQLAWSAVQRRDFDALAELVAPEFRQEDRRALAGDPLVGADAVQKSFERAFEFYDTFEPTLLAVRGERLALAEFVFRSEAGDENRSYAVFEVDPEGRIAWQARLDSDDLHGATSLLEDRFSSTECPEFVGCHEIGARLVSAYQRADWDAYRALLAPEFVLVAHGSRVFETRTADELIETERAFGGGGLRVWNSVVHVLSAEVGIARNERHQLQDGAVQAEWSRIVVASNRDGYITEVHTWNVEDVDDAMAFATRRAAELADPLPLRNSASARIDELVGALRDRDLDRFFSFTRPDLVRIDHRRAASSDTGDPDSLRESLESWLDLAPEVTHEVLAVRGDRLAAAELRFENRDGFGVTVDVIVECGHDELVARILLFDEDDFDPLMRQLDERHYAGEGSAHARAGKVSLELMSAFQRADWAGVRRLLAPGMRWRSHNASVFDDRTPDEVIDTHEALFARAASFRAWLSAMQWVSTCQVARYERRVVLSDGTETEWSYGFVGVVDGGRCGDVHVLPGDDIDAAVRLARSIAEEA